MPRVILRYDRGTLLALGGFRIPGSVYDERLGVYRAAAIRYSDALEYIRASGLDYQDEVMDPIPAPRLVSKTPLRPYQATALRNWSLNGKKGVVVLPTGAGKTLVGIKAVESVGLSALVVVPTLDLLWQWKEALEKELDLEVGVLGGESFELKAITVSTYDSAYLRAAELGNKFYLLVFDECHHLPSEGYRQIAEMFASPYRLGLTATPEREDGLHRDLAWLIGGLVYRASPSQLAGRYLSEYRVEKIVVNLTPEEKIAYEAERAKFTSYVRRMRIYPWDSRGLLKLIMMSGRDPDAREALLARNRATQIAFNSEAKLKSLEKILKENRQEKIIVFTQYNDLVYQISSRFLMPFITYKTSPSERADVLKKFKDGEYGAIVASKVLDEGVDVPEASLGVILSGSGSTREFVQRLGRLLRKREGKLARLIEIVSAGTSEMSVSYRRGRRLRQPGGPSAEGLAEERGEGVCFSPP
ncbi:MAG: DEAD/DEAH box helicase [Thermoprotei archaeon]|nr:DEAD/DEAH box helicase family protein [TACK group archaeon]